MVGSPTVDKAAAVPDPSGQLSKLSWDGDVQGALSPPGEPRIQAVLTGRHPLAK